MMKLICVIFAMALAFESCIVEHHSIPIGTYLSPSGEESVSARESQLHFHVRIHSEHPDRFVNRTCDYAVHKGHIALHSDMAATSAEAAFGFARYDWEWDGVAIIRRDPRTGEIVRFTPQRPPH
jgi:hypothetical protein